VLAVDAGPIDMDVENPTAAHLERDFGETLLA
jgi:hypothetical protein